MGQGRLTLVAGVALCAALALSLTAVASADAKAVWLCKPGAADNPCEPSLKTSVLSTDGQVLDVDKVKAARRPKVDCFYVYPTVSDQKTANANLNIDPVQRSVALYQAARYSTECRVFAPMYRQVTLDGLGAIGGGEEFDLAYSDVLAAWQEYMSKHNKGRGVVLIGHSQGTFILERLVAEQIDPSPKARRKLVSALLLGGNVTVAEGSDVGGSFQNIRTCHSKAQLGCLVAFSTFNDAVPKGAIFGRAGAGEDVVCVNPAKPGGGISKVDTIAAGIAFAAPTRPSVDTPWLEFEGAYSGGCSSADDADALLITAAPGAPKLNASPTAVWGLHLIDANIALGDLVALVHKQARKFVKKQRR